MAEGKEDLALDDDFDESNDDHVAAAEDDEEEDSYCYADSDDEERGVADLYIGVDVEFTAKEVGKTAAYQWQKEWRECPYSGHQDETDCRKFFVNVWQDVVVEVALDARHPLKPPKFDVSFPAMDPETTLLIRTMEFVEPKKWNFCTRLADLLKYVENVLRRGRPVLDGSWSDLQQALYDLGLLLEAQPKVADAVERGDLDLPKFGEESALKQVDLQHKEDTKKDTSDLGGVGASAGAADEKGNDHDRDAEAREKNSAGAAAKKRKVGGWSAGTGYGSGMLSEPAFYKTVNNNNNAEALASSFPTTETATGAPLPNNNNNNNNNTGNTSTFASVAAASSLSKSSPPPPPPVTQKAKTEARTTSLLEIVERIDRCVRREDAEYVREVSTWQRAVLPFVRSASLFEFEKYASLFDKIEAVATKVDDEETLSVLRRRKPCDDVLLESSDEEPEASLLLMNNNNRRRRRREKPTTGVPLDTEYRRLLGPEHVLQKAMPMVNHTHHLAAHKAHLTGTAADDPRQRTPSSDPSAPVPPQLAKRAFREFQTLLDGLPLDEQSSIFARHNSDNLLHFKLCIVPSAETPYAYGCFVFSLVLPRDYPQSPPSVDFQTTDGGRVRFNPNLYADGKVCLSLLGTWPGRPEEMWDPDNSNLLSVALSIQALIFTDEPYFNEPGYEARRGTPAGDDALRKYNNDVKFHTKRVAVDAYYHRPPPEFEGVVRKHLDFHANNILRTFGAPLGAGPGNALTVPPRRRHHHHGGHHHQHHQGQGGFGGGGAEGNDTHGGLPLGTVSSSSSSPAPMSSGALLPGGGGASSTQHNNKGTDHSSSLGATASLGSTSSLETSNSAQQPFWPPQNDFLYDAYLDEDDDDLVVLDNYSSHHPVPAGAAPLPPLHLQPLQLQPPLHLHLGGGPPPPGASFAAANAAGHPPLLPVAAPLLPPALPANHPPPHHHQTSNPPV